ncbi:hypothetical protein BY996DRAFT_6413457 [Phakopsora pachyrhizi]|nr:hypothetical protein BY996DRAFT_6413457 [Phakopsora pachyrhizi]
MLSWSTCALILFISKSSLATSVANNSLTDALPENVTKITALNSIPGDMSSGSCMCPPPPACGASTPPAPDIPAAPPAPATPSAAPPPDISSPTPPTAAEAPPKEEVPPPPVNGAFKLKQFSPITGVVIASIFSFVA